jgi:hypothetical protein
MQNVAVTEKGERGPVPARVNFLLATEAPIGVIFRGGPSNWVEVLKWNTADQDVIFECSRKGLWHLRVPRTPGLEMKVLQRRLFAY